MTEVMQVREAYRVEQWRQLMQQRKDSPLNNREFCAQQGISEKSNYYWLKKLRESAGSCSQVHNVTYGAGRTENKSRDNLSAYFLFMLQFFYKNSATSNILLI